MVSGDFIINMPSAGVCMRTLRAYSKYGSNVRGNPKMKLPEARDEKKKKEEEDEGEKNSEYN